ncbi:hypothetical protein KCU60_g34, partial [Aureobasidium melanogenum]
MRRVMEARRSKSVIRQQWLLNHVLTIRVSFASPFDSLVNGAYNAERSYDRKHRQTHPCSDTECGRSTISSNSCEVSVGDVQSRLEKWHKALHQWAE